MDFIKSWHSMIWSIIAVGIVILMLLCNTKVKLIELAKEQIAVFR